MGTQVLTVRGMTCSHCERAVTAEIGRLPGVQQVEVELSTGTVRVQANRELDDAELATAIDEAGYELAPGPAEPHR